MKPAIVKVLAECNKIRESLGRKPVKQMRKGVILSSSGCPIVRTVGLGYMTYHRGWWWNLGRHESSPELIEFAKDFDAGKYPELDLAAVLKKKEQS